MRGRSVREHTHRLPLECYQGQVAVSFTACISGRLRAFTDERLVSAFIGILEAVATKHECIVLVYCFMPDHVHVVLQGTTDQADTWRAMVEFKQRTGYWFRVNHMPYVWQKDFHDHVMRVDEDLKEHVRYVANNPVRKGIARSVSECPFVGAVGADLATVIGDAL